jgi:hypothetical protein
MSRAGGTLQTDTLSPSFVAEANESIPQDISVRFRIIFLLTHFSSATDD